jgi:2-dehydro-3-deoxy-D-arabinonate dehydratase
MPPPIRLFATDAAVILECDGRFARAADGFSIDGLFAAADPVEFAAASFHAGTALADAGATRVLRAPIEGQEVWAAGVTYLRSKDARMAESQDAGGGSFYDRVYSADRPELFFKAAPHRVAAPGSPVRIRRDSKWNVPEPELTLAIDSRGRIFGYTIGNDMSSRDIEGENPLYLPQAKVYSGCASIGPCIVISADLPPPQTVIAIEILRAGTPVFAGETSIDRIKRPLASLAEWLFREDSFPRGCFLMTGTGVVPPDSFTLQAGDEIRITVEPVGTLGNVVA